VRSITSVLKKAALRPSEIGHINAHGKSTKRDDLVEARAYHGALGSAAESIPVTGLKSYFGTFDAGAGAVELAASVLALTHGVVPFTLNYNTPDPLCRLNVIHHEPMRLKSLTALKVNRTAMGQSAAAVLRSV
jgi:3-oxoacyl-[acyl-carrier-protein] synthase II